LATLVLLGGIAPAWSQDKILVPGDPPLTQEVVNLYQEMWQWYCDIKLTPEQRRQHTQHFITVWKTKGPADAMLLLDGYRRMEKEWRGVLELKGTEQDRKRAEVSTRWLTILRKAADDPPGRFLVSVYDDAYKPGGSKNPILVKGDPPLTKTTIDQETFATEWLLDTPMTEEQRQDFQRLLIARWATMDKAKKESWVKNAAATADLLRKVSPYQRHFLRAARLASILARMDKADADAASRWLLTLYRDISKPGSKRNPVLVDGKPPLTQELVDRYGDYVEVMLDLSVSGGLTAPQRQVLQEYLVKDWEKMDATVKEEMLADLKRWADAAGQGVAEVNKQLGALGPKLMAQLETARNDERSKWLLEIALRERKKAELLSAGERQRHETMMQLIGNLAPTMHWEHNSRTGRHDLVPGR
jgi:hypothetical protein